jgi:hypothetical protein
VLSSLTLAAALAAPGATAALTGCQNEANTPEARTAEQAVGISPKTEKSTAVEATRDVTVVKDTKVIDNATGETISETKQSTPVKITQQKEVRTDVKVDVGNTSAVKPGAEKK